MADAYKTFTLITGASRGIGAELARLCAADGHNLILVAREGDKLRQLAQEIGQDITVHTIVQDLSEHGAAEKIYKKARRWRAEIDQLINNAGVGEYGEFATAKGVYQERLIAVNITSLTLLTRFFLPAMVKRRQGRILNVASVAGFAPMPRLSVYAASKSFVISFSQALSEELRGSGVTVTCLCPGRTRTGFSRAAHIPSTHPIARSKTSPAAVARFGYRAMMSGAPLAIHGFSRRILVSLVYRLLPRGAIRRIMHAYNKG